MSQNKRRLGAARRRDPKPKHEGTATKRVSKSRMRATRRSGRTPDLVHKAVPGDRAGYCAVCGQRIRLVPGGHGPTWVHADSGAVAAPNPPSKGTP